MTYGVIMNIRLICCAAIFYAMITCAPSQDLCRGVLEISGIQDDQVFQRNRQDRSDFCIAGRIAANTNGTLELRILRRVFALNNVNYFRKVCLFTDNRCDSLNQFIDGGPIYVGKTDCSK